MPMIRRLLLISLALSPGPSCLEAMQRIVDIGTTRLQGIRPAHHQQHQTGEDQGCLFFAGRRQSMAKPGIEIVEFLGGHDAVLVTDKPVEASACSRSALEGARQRASKCPSGLTR